MQIGRIYKHTNWLPIICWLFLAVFGWINIYASVYSPDAAAGIMSSATKSGNQFLWIVLGCVTALLLYFVIPPKIYLGMTWLLYMVAIALLIAVLIFGREINGARSWLSIGSFSLQPSEISKITTAMALSTVMGSYDFRFTDHLSIMKVAGIMLLPIALIAMEPDMGTILVYCSLSFMFYREGMTGWILLLAMFMVLIFVLTLKFSTTVAILSSIGILGILYSLFSRNTVKSLLLFTMFISGAAFFPQLYTVSTFSFLRILEPAYWIILITVPFVVYMLISGRGRNRYRRYFAAVYMVSLLMTFSVQKVFDDILQQHHRDRIENLLGITEDLKGAGYNVHQSEIAIGSGGFAGKGYLNGTQTKFSFVPEQSTDFIFCTIGEEWGFLGALSVLAAYMAIIIYLISSAEKQKDTRFRIYGYSVACILFTHVFVNIGMTIGIMPVVGIPLPFMSYGGSSFLSFTVMLFIYLRLDLERWR